MKNILSGLSFKSIIQNLKQCQQRFPVPMSLCVILAIIFLLLLHGNFDTEIETYLTRSIFTIIVTFFLSIWATIYIESQKLWDRSKLIYSLVPLVFWVLFFLTFNSDIDNFENFIFFVISLFGIIWILFIAPYIQNIIKRNTKNDIYYSYFYKVSTVFLLSGILWGVMFGLGAIGISAVFSLFDIGYQYNEIYGDWAIFSLVVFTPIFALSNLPQKNEYTKASFTENTFFSFLIKYIATPCICIYFLILYAYTIKVLLNFSDWPKGEVSWMVIGFSTFGYIVYMFSQAFESSFKLVEVFRKYFPYVVLPQIAMLFYAIGLRIWQYDITINRYFVVVFGIWLLVTSLYFIWDKKKYIGIIPALLTIFTIIISIGPWSVYSMPEARQLQRLKNNLQKANMLKEGQVIVPTHKNIDLELWGEIYNGIHYICDLNDCSSIKELFQQQYTELEIQHRQEFENQQETDLQYTYHYNKKWESVYNPPNKWEIKNHITDTLWVKPYYKNNTGYTQKYINYHIDYNTGIFPLDVTGYKQVLSIVAHTNTSSSWLHIRVNTRTKNMFLYNGTDLIQEQDISDIQQQISLLNEGKVTQKQMTFSIDEESISGKLIFRNINIPSPLYETENIDDYYYTVDGYFLMK